MKDFSHESNEIIERYRRRTQKDKSCLYNMAKNSVAISRFRFNQELLTLLAKNFGCDFPLKKYLEVGCGTGNNLSQLISFGVEPKNLTGNDIYEPSLEIAKNRLPSCVELRQGNFVDLKYEKKFDVILFSTVLSSILDTDLRKECINKAYDLLNKDGIVVIYDFTYNNPKNKDVQKVVFHDFFSPGCPKYSKSSVKRITLAPPIARRLENFPFLIKLFEKIKILNTHMICCFKK